MEWDEVDIVNEERLLYLLAENCYVKKKDKLMKKILSKF